MDAFTAEDLYQHRVLAGLDGSSRHAHIVFRVKHAVRDSEKYESTCWHWNGDGPAPPRVLTDAAFGAQSPRLSPDADTLAFISRRGGDSAQVQLLPMHGGEARQLTRSDNALSAIQEWSSDGERLLLTASVPWSEHHDEGDAEARQRSKDNGAARPQVARFLPYKKDGSGVIVGERVQLFAADARSGELQPLVQGDCDVSGASWSPDGTRLAYIRNRDGRQRHRTDLWLADAEGRDPGQRTDSLASISKAEWSPDGRSLALVAGKIEGDSMMQLWLVDANGDAGPRRLGDDDFELTPESTVVWHPDGTRVAVIAARKGLQQIAIVDIATGAVRCVQHGLRQVLGLAACGDRLAFIVASMRWPDELHSVDWNGGGPRRHSEFNRRWISQRPQPRVRKRRFAVPDGDGGSEKIDAWLLLPASGEGPYPLLVDMHGGPQSQVLVDYAMHTYWYVLLSRGWAILAPNAVGSGGYGVGFAKRLCGRWGELDFPQYLAILDTLQREGLADARIVCTGKSYGGYLSAWAIGNSDRFKAAIVSAPVSDIQSHAGTSDTGYYVTPYAMGGEFHETSARAHALSPVTHCLRVTTPTLILQGAEDGRCPIGQSEQLFANLIRCSEVAAELVVYPGGSHSLAETGKPGHRVDYHQRLCDWAKRWTDSQGAGSRRASDQAAPADGSAPREAA